MWLKNDDLKVFFDERKGGMPVGDSFGFIRAASIEIACTWPPPFFQSIEDRGAHVKKYGDSKLMVSGIMRKDVPGEISPHTYEMVATLKGNRLNLAYKLNAARTEGVIVSKVWFLTKFFQKCAITGEEVFNVGDRVGGEEVNWFYPFVKGLSPEERWNCLYTKEGGQPESVALFDSGGRLEILGSTAPPVHAKVFRYKRERMEVAFTWASGLLSRGMYSGNFTLIYE